MSAAYARPRQRQPIDLRLDGNEGPQLAPAQLARLLDSDPEIVRRYPDAGELEEALASRFGLRAEQVLVTAGGDDALERIFRCRGGPGREVVVPGPTFEMIERYVAASGAAAIMPPWRAGSYPVEAVLAAISERTAAIVVVSPNNPDGLVASTEDLRRLREAAPGIPIVCDLAYAEFAREDLTEVALSLPDVVVVRTFSKAWGLAGLRVGYALGPAPWIAKLRGAGAPYPVAAPSLALARDRLRSGGEAVARFAAATRVRRERLQESLRTAGVRVTDSEANFVFADSPRSAWIADACAGFGIALRRFPGRAGLENAVRITCPRDGFEDARLRAALEVALAPEALLFDMDGVLVDVSASYRRCIIETAARFGAGVEAREIVGAKARGGANDDWALTHRLVTGKGVAASLADVTEVFERLYQGDGEVPGHRRAERLIPARQTLERLALRLPLAVVTGRPRRDAALALRRFGLDGLFREVIGREDAPRLKPDPAPVRLALDRIGVKRAWMVGDTPDDLVAARAAGVLPLGFAAPGEEPAAAADVLARAGAARVLESLTELEELLP